MKHHSTLPTYPNIQMPRLVWASYHETDIDGSQLVATLHQAQMAAVRVAAPINIERFDNLSTWDIFQVPKVEEVMGIDHVARMTVALPVTCVGPLDPINVLVNISPNPDYPKARKIRVSRIQVVSLVFEGLYLDLY